MTQSNNHGDAQPEKFFVSYNKADKAWAEWISWQLETVGYVAFLQAWDIRPGANFIIAMQKATEDADRTLAVLSPDYLSAQFTQPEWTAAFNQDPTGEKGLLVPVRVKEVDLRGMWTSIVYIDLVGLTEEQAKQALISSLSGKRGKPETPPHFPGRSIDTVKETIEEPQFPVADVVEDPFLEWAVLVVQLETDESFTFQFRKEDTRLMELSHQLLTTKGKQRLIKSFIRESEQSNDMDKISAVLYELLIPGFVSERLLQVKQLAIIVDAETARYPWELSVNRENPHLEVPFAVKTIMIRGVIVREYRMRIAELNTNNTPHILIIGDPLSQGMTLQSPIAFMQARMVGDIWAREGHLASMQIGSEFTRIMDSLFNSDYSAIHLSASAVYDESYPENSGLLIGNQLVLTIREFAQMSKLPDLFFISYHEIISGKRLRQPNNNNTSEMETSFSSLAGHLGTSLIQLGAKAVVVSGWKTQEKPNLAFTKAFYETMLSGRSFAEAVQSARSIAWHVDPNGSTWGSYQCYGDPNFHLNTGSRPIGPPEPYYDDPDFPRSRSI